MIDAVLKKIFGTKHERDVKRAMPVVAEINALEPAMQALDDGGLLLPGLATFVIDDMQ